MPKVDPVLIQITTAANMAGIEQAKAGMLGLKASTIALAAVLAAAIVVGKAAIENYKAQEEALLGLKQATDATKQSYDQIEPAVEDFINTNKAYISNQYDVITASAMIVRAGNNQKDMLRLLNDALDLSVIKHEDVSAAAKTLILAENGNSKALRELGISTTEYSAIMKDKKLTAEQKDAELLALIESKTKDGKKATDENAQSQNKLTKDWQDFTSRIGPGLTEVWTSLNNALDTGIQILDLADQALVKLGQDAKNPVWGDLQNFLVTLSGKPVADGLRALISLLGATGGSSGSSPTKPFGAGRASGGSVAAGETYTVGEHGIETLVMGNQNGTIVPNGAMPSGTGAMIVYVNVNGGYVGDNRQLALAIRESLRRLDREQR